MRGQGNDFANSVNRKTEKSAEKNLHLCRFGAFENPLFSMGASHPGFGSHSKVGLQAPNVCWLPAGTPSVRQKDRQVTNTAEVMEAVADFHHQFIIPTGVRQAPLKQAKQATRGFFQPLALFVSVSF